MTAQSWHNLSTSEAVRRCGRNQSQAYRIMVAGVLAPDWSDRLGGLRIETRMGDSAGHSVTVLEGLIRDQAQLSGVLNTLYDLRLILLGVELIEDVQGSPSPDEPKH